MSVAWNDTQWLQKLHALGLLQGSFRPDAEIAALRTLVRYRAELIQHRSPHILHMQRALQQMNIQLERVVSDIMGQTGQAIVRAIVAGERDSLAGAAPPARLSLQQRADRQDADRDVEGGTGVCARSGAGAV